MSCGLRVVNIPITSLTICITNINSHRPSRWTYFVKTSSDASRTAKWLGIYCRSEIYKEINSLSYLPKNMSLKVLLGASTSNCLVLYPASDNLPPQAFTGVHCASWNRPLWEFISSNISFKGRTLVYLINMQDGKLGKIWEFWIHEQLFDGPKPFLSSLLGLKFSKKNKYAARLSYRLEYSLFVAIGWWGL